MGLVFLSDFALRRLATDHAFGLALCSLLLPISDSFNYDRIAGIRQEFAEY